MTDKAMPTVTALTLAELAVGDCARVLGYAKAEAVYKRRLLAMGLTPRTEFTVVRVAPLGDPVEIRVRGSALTLRKDEAVALRIERC